MGAHRSSFVLPALLLLCVSSGCLCFRQSVSATVQVRDAETHQPIPGATVKASYFGPLFYVTPDQTPGTTGKDGMVRLPVVPDDNTLWDLVASAPGYTGGGLDNEAHEQIRRSVGKQLSVMIEMYARPDHVVELVVPNDYRGLVFLKQRLVDAGQLPRGQRVLPAVVSPSGVATVQLPSLLECRALDVRARFAGGGPIEGAPTKDRVGLHETGINTAEGKFYFVGTQQELDRSEDHFFYDASPPQSTLNNAKVEAWLKAHR
jgi:hypothetical protein